MTFTVGTDLDQLADGVFVQFLHWKVSLYISRLSTLYILERSHYGQPILREWGVMVYHSEDRVATKIIFHTQLLLHRWAVNYWSLNLGPLPPKL